MDAQLIGVGESWLLPTLTMVGMTYARCVTYVHSFYIKSYIIGSIYLYQVCTFGTEFVLAMTIQLLRHKMHNLSNASLALNSHIYVYSIHILLLSW